MDNFRNFSDTHDLISTSGKSSGCQKNGGNMHFAEHVDQIQKFARIVL